MRIGFDVTALRTQQTGVGTYTANLLQHLRCLPQLDILPMARERTPNNTLWLQLVLPRHLARAGVDVCHFTNNVGPVWTPCPSILTIHDLSLWLYPRYHPKRRILAMRPFIPVAARRARAIIAVSFNTKRDLVRTLHIPESKIHVIHEAPAPQFRPIARLAELERVRHTYDLPDAFILYVGTIEPRKNLGRLLAAFAMLRRSGFASHGLVLAGARGWADTDILSRVERLGLGGAVRLLGYVPHADLPALYNLAAALAFPSHYEGFGLPVVEAMACGTPVVTSPNGSLSEIARGAAEFVDPRSVESIAAGLRHVLEDAQQQAELSTAGLARAAEFNWQRVAAQTAALYANVISRTRATSLGAT